MIVLTGGAGFIGSNILQQLNELGMEDIIVVDNLNHPLKEQNLKRKKFHQYFAKKDFLEVLPSLENITAILHQGACSSTTETNEAYLQQNNVAYSTTLLHYAIEKNIPFIYASSASVYGDGKLGFDDNSNDYLPINGYAKSKLQFDKYVTWVLEDKQPSNKIIGLRYFNVYGFGEAHKEDMSSVVYKFYQQYMQCKTIELFEGSSAILRDFIAVNDVVSVNMHCWQQPVQNGIYNVGTGKAASFQALADAFMQFYPDATLNYIPFPKQLENKYQFFTEANINKLQKQSYTKNFMTINEGVALYLKQLQQNENG